ncbi:30S ribosomal protein S17 [Myxococcota bacterium]|nr:30S ribosomal protein S17 [Myxococcota bacterium]
MAENETQGAVEEQGAEAKRIQKERQGVVVSAKQNKTVTVAVTRRVKHGRYGKFIERQRKYAVHDTLGCKEGDIVRIRETRPLSKTKRWRVVEKLEKGA